MKVIIQRVKSAELIINSKIISKIKQGLVVFACVEKGDDLNTIDWFAEKLTNLRVFPDKDGKFNLSVKEIGGEILLVSNFTICGILKKGTRPSFHNAENPEIAKNLLEILAKKIRDKGISVKEGVFGAHMKIKLINDGPVTLYIEKQVKYSNELN